MSIWDCRYSATWSENEFFMALYKVFLRYEKIFCTNFVNNRVDAMGTFLGSNEITFEVILGGGKKDPRCTVHTSFIVKKDCIRIDAEE
jgi:hypothetical protein